MGTEFNWQTESDAWDEAAPTAVLPRPVSPFRGLIRWLIPMLIFLSAASVAYWQLQLRAAETATRLQAEVLSSHQIIVDAAGTADQELLISFLSGRDPGWTTAYEQLLRDGLLFDYQLLGLMPIAGPAPTPTITLSADLRAAELLTERRYAIYAAGSVTETIRLRRTDTYRLGPDRWLWSPPDDDFWGRKITVSSRHLALTFPERDADLMHRLAADLETAVSRLCALEQLRCVSSRRLRVNFAASPDSLLQLPNLRQRLRDRQGIILPAPSLIGIPLDDAGYEALRQGYLRLLAAPLLVELLAWNCCPQAWLVQALVDRQLADLGLAVWPMSAADYDQLYRDAPSLRTLAFLWERDPDRLDEVGRRQLHGLVDFVMTLNPEVTPIAMLRPVVRGATLDRWLTGLTDATGEPTWYAFLSQRSALSRLPPPRPLPEQRVLVRCEVDGTPEQRFSFYDPAADHWLADAMLPVTGNFVRIKPLAGEALLVQEMMRTGIEQHWRTSLWREGKLQRLNDAYTSWGFLRSHNPDESLLLFHNLNGVLTEYIMLDLPACLAGDCRMIPRQGSVEWSPDGRQTLVNVPEPFGRQSPTIFLGDERGEPVQELARGYSPFWLDETTFVYGRLLDWNARDMEWVVATLAGEELAVLPLRRLLDNLPPAIDRSSYTLAVAKPNPGRPEQLLVPVYREDNDSTQLFLYDWPSDRLTRINTPVERYEQTEFSPDGRFLAIYSTTFSSDSASLWQLSLLDLDTGRQQPLGTGMPFFWSGPQWTRDGGWLLRHDSEIIYLVAAGTDYQRPIFPEDGRCLAAAWLLP